LKQYETDIAVAKELVKLCIGREFDLNERPNSAKSLACIH